MARGEPGVPKAFSWRGERFEVARIVATKRAMGEDRGDVYLRRHYYEVETTDALRMALYFERNPSDRSKRKAWWLYTVAFPDPVIETSRLLLRRWTYADRGAFRHMTADPDVMRFIHDSVPLSGSEADRALANTVTHYKFGFGDWAIIARESGTIMGESGLTMLEGNDEIEIGWMLLPKYWGFGYASEAARAVKQYAFETLGLKRVVALARPANDRSIALICKLGMQPIGRTMHRGHEMLKFDLQQM